MFLGLFAVRSVRQIVVNATVMRGLAVASILTRLTVGLYSAVLSPS